MIFMPPGHAKTEFVSRMLPAFVFGRNPDVRIIACSHTADFTGLLNREVQRIMEEERYRRLFADSRLNDRAVKASSFGQYRRTTDYFEIVGHHGFYRSTGVGGTLHGIRFDLGIIDDPIKSWEYANSPTCRQKLWEWYARRFSSRQWTNAAIVLMHTRFHRDDLAGRLLRKMLDRREEQWEVLSLPAIRTATQTHPEDLRQVGEPLWTAFKDYDALERERHKDSKAFAALYQQDPSEAGMNEWRRNTLPATSGARTPTGRLTSRSAASASIPAERQGQTGRLLRHRVRWPIRRRVLRRCERRAPQR